MSFVLRTSVLFFLVVLASAALPCRLHGQDDKAYHAAKAEFEKGMKEDEAAPRQAAIRRLRSTNDPRAVKDLKAAVHKLNKTLDSNQKKLDPLLEERAEIAADIDKRFDGKKSIPMGSVQNLLKKRDELEKKVRPMEQSMRVDHDTRNAVLRALGDLITSLPEASQAAETQEIVDLLGKFKKIEERKVYIDMLAAVRTQQSATALTAIALGDPDKDMRILALGALGSLGDKSGAPAAVKSVADDYWAVRAAAVQALAALGSFEGVPALVDRLEKEDGRLKDDIEGALADMAGTTFFDNVQLWKDWWKANEKKFGEIVAAATSDSPVARDNALREASEFGFLLAVREWLHRRGLSLTAVRDQEARRTAKPEETPWKFEEIEKSLADADLVGNLDAAAKAISTRAEAIRRRALQAMIVQPYRRTQDVEKKLILARILGRVRSLDIDAAVKSAVAAAGDKTSPHAALKVVNVALGSIDNDESIALLLDSYRDVEPVAGVCSAAAEGLGKIGNTEALKALFSCLATAEALVNDKKTDFRAVRETIYAELERVTGGKFGADASSWFEWWRANSATFKARKDVAPTAAGDAKANPEGAPRGTSFYGVKTASKRLCYVLDISGSMNEPADYGGSTNTKFKVARQELENSIVALPDDALFNIVFYSTKYTVWKPKLIQANAAAKKEAKEMIAGLTAEGATNIYDSLAKAFDFAGRGSFDKGYAVALDTIFFLSDGQANQGLYTQPSDILRHILDLNATKRITIHAIGVGRDHDRSLMKALADATGGTYVAR